MEAFQYRDANSVETAISANSSQPGGKFVAGGTTLIDLMKLNVETPRLLVDINHLPLTQVETSSDGGVRIGAMVRNSDLANHELIKQRYPVLPAGTALRRFAAIAEHGYDRRKPAATHSLLLLSGHGIHRLQ